MKLEQLYTKYLEVLKLEIEYFNHKPTELRHLIGRLGEIFCAIQTKGSLAQEVNCIYRSIRTAMPELYRTLLQ